jgi:hypothetical protein
VPRTATHDPYDPYDPYFDEYSASSQSVWRSRKNSHAVAEVYGSTVVPALTVGTPSPVFESSAIDAGFRPVPFRPDTILDGWTAGEVTLRGASLRGHLHRFNGAPREDDFAIHRLPDGRVIALVADGVSEARQAHIGSALAIRSAAEWLYTSMAADTAATDWQHCIASVAWAMNEQAQRLLNLPQPDPVIAEEYLATTLVVAVIESTPSGALRVHLVSVGDSCAWALSDGTFHDLLRDSRGDATPITTSAVDGLPRVPNKLVPIVIDIHPGEVLLIGTDGFGDPLGNGDGGVGNLFRDVLGRGVPPSLTEFAHALDFSREAFDDDRTLVAVWPDGARSNGAKR